MQPAATCPTVQLKGQILGIDTARNEVLIRHGAITGFMPAMTMPYKVKDAGLLTGKVPATCSRRRWSWRGRRLPVVADATGHSRSTRRPRSSIDHVCSSPANRLPTRCSSIRAASRTRCRRCSGTRRADVYLHTLPAARLLPADGAALRRHAATVKRNPELADVRLVTITMDPEFDTPAVLRPHAPTGADPPSGRS